MTLFEKVAQEIKNRIASGEYTTTLPSISELSSIHRIGPSTVKRTLNWLKQQEYIRGFQGKCVMVNPAACNNPYFRKNVVVCANMELLGNQFYGFVLNDLNHHLSELNCRITFVNSVRRLRECGTDLDAAILIEVADNAELKEAAAVCGRDHLLLLGMKKENYLYVDTDNTVAGVQAMEYLHGELGHRKIGLLGIELGLELSYDRQRFAGAEHYAAAHPDLQLFTYEYTRGSDPQQSVAGMLEEHPDITAVFAARDYLALGCYSYCQSRHIPIPQKFSVLGFDDRDFAALQYPPLTTFQQNKELIAREALTHILNILNPGAVPLPSYMSKPVLIRRGSCGKAPVSFASHAFSGDFQEKKKKTEEVSREFRCG